MSDNDLKLLRKNEGEYKKLDIQQSTKNKRPQINEGKREKPLIESTNSIAMKFTCKELFLHNPMTYWHYQTSNRND